MEAAEIVKETAELREAAHLYHEYCVALGQSRSRAELAALMRIVFPAGTLPGETDPITFTARELEIFRSTAWRTDEVEARLTLAVMSAIEWH
jgi:hypothetical protein